jgi:hypothetical protein
MKKHYALTLAVVGLATAFSVRAQPATASNANGLLGQRYAEASVGAIDPHGSSDEGFAGNLSVNVPVQAGLDVGFGYTYDRITADIGSGFHLRSRNHTLGATVTGYSTLAGVKPFAGAGLGYQWSRTKLDFGGARVLDTDDDDGLWALGVGVEIPLGAVTVTPTVTYQDGFSQGAAAGFAYGAEAHMWLTRTVGGFVGATYSDPVNGGRQSWLYEIGARMRF